jgi:FkbM family methyltransferase
MIKINFENEFLLKLLFKNSSGLYVHGICFKHNKEKDDSLLFESYKKKDIKTIWIEELDELLKHYKQANLYLFEPSLLNYKRLNLQFAKEKNIKIINKALSNKNGFGFLYSEKSGSGLASLFKRRLDHFNTKFNIKEKIILTRLDNFLKNRNIIIDYFKIDAEGSEIKILEGFGKFIGKIKLIQFEFGGCNIDSRTFFQDFWYYFKKHNFDLYRITLAGPQKINTYNEIDEYFKTTNYIALNKNL